MKAMVLEGFNKPLQLRDVSVPEAGTDDVLIRMKVCSICGTDSKIIGGKIKSVKLPLIPGHEPSGEIVKVGSNVSQFEPGDRVIVSIYITCGYCKNCIAGKSTVCLNSIKRLGFEVNGGFAEFAVAPADNVIKIPEGISYEEASLTLNAVSSSVHAFYDHVDINHGDHVLVIGTGGLSLHGLQVLKAIGAVVTIAGRNDEKLNLAKELGADFVFNMHQGDLIDACKEITNGYGMDVVGDYVGLNQTCELGIECLRMGGTMILMGYSPETTFNVSSMDLAMSEKVIVGTRAMNKHNIIEGLELVKNGKIKFIVDKRYPLEEVNDALKKLGNEGFVGRGVVIIEE